MRTRDEMLRTLREIQSSCLDRGFYGGRAFEMKSTRGSSATTELSAMETASKEATEKSLALVETLQSDIAELHTLLENGDLL